MKIIFFGTPQFAVPTLKRLIDHSQHQVLALVCQPDRPAGRGHNLHVPATKMLALEHEIPILQPERLSKAPEIVAELQSLQSDLIVMVAFGQILKKEVLSLPRLGVLNLHGSLLPFYRGAAPINWAIINGESESGVTTMFTELGVDSGPVLLKYAVPISIDMTAEALAFELSKVGADLVIETLSKLEVGTLEAQRQDDSQATFAPILKKDTGKLDWTCSALRVHNLVRGLIPWPGTFTAFRDQPLKIWKTRIEVSSEMRNKLDLANKASGSLIIVDKHVFVRCGNDGAEFLELLEVQPPGKARLTAAQWANGARLSPDERFV